MRYAVFSDVHSNLEAFEAVLDAAKTSRVDSYLFIGDIVGYGADPSPCIALLRSLACPVVAGNHDWASVEKTPTEYFNEAAAEAVLWTRERLSEFERAYLCGQGLVHETPHFCLVHGTLDHPEEFDYMTDGGRAARTFYLLRQQICFVGHSHMPGVFVDDGEKVTYHGTEKIAIEAGRRYIINDGSVGQPRDGDPRASFCIYDTEASSVEFRRVPYDIASAQKKIRQAGLPGILADRLFLGR